MSWIKKCKSENNIKNLTAMELKMTFRSFSKFFVSGLSVFITLVLGCMASLKDVHGEVHLAPGFGKNMILQRDIPAKVSGWADIGEAVVVKLGDQIVGQSVGEGPEKFRTVILPILKAGPIPDITVKGKNTITLTNLLAGDVWICSGQSNMEMTVIKGLWCPYGGVLNAEYWTPLSTCGLAFLLRSPDACRSRVEVTRAFSDG